DAAVDGEAHALQGGEPAEGLDDVHRLEERAHSSVTRGLIDHRGGPRNGPPRPPALGAPRETRGAPRCRAGSSIIVGGPRNGPPCPPHVRSAPGEPVALLGTRGLIARPAHAVAVARGRCPEGGRSS